MKFYTRRRVSPVITIVSLVDILTMVLMFFVYTTTFKTNQPKVDIVLPSTKDAGTQEAKSQPVILTISPEGDLYLDEKPVAVEALGAMVKDLTAQNKELALKADEKAPFGKILTIMEALKSAGVENLPAFTRPSK